jgi:hypothetical protein
MSDLPKGPISWEDAAKLSDEYAEVLATEEFGHELYIDDHGVLRWVKNYEKEQEIMDEFGASDLNQLFARGADKNDPRIRELYKHIGYSLSGFWEIFYWEVNNPQAYKYFGRNADTLTPIKRMKFQVWVDMDEDMDEDEFDELFDELLEPLEDVEIGGCSVRKVNIYADSDDY